MLYVNNPRYRSRDDHRGFRHTEKTASHSGNSRFLSHFYDAERSAFGQARRNRPGHRRTLRCLPSRNLRNRNPPLHDQRENGHRGSAGPLSHRGGNRETRNGNRGIRAHAGEKERVRKWARAQNAGTERFKDDLQARRNSETGRCCRRHCHRLYGVVSQTSVDEITGTDEK